MNAAFCCDLFLKSCKCKEKERREDLHPGLGVESNLGPPELLVAKCDNHCTMPYP